MLKRAAETPLVSLFAEIDAMEFEISPENAQFLQSQLAAGQ
jgi:hypothetical protein